ncbi:MAG: hypothetical protein COB13_012760 [OCS116 cluster bacterium]|nr:hypothetical protein [OCS116 cluster bacterium]
MQSFGIFSLTKRNEVRLGGASAPDQRLSGLASDAEHRARSAQYKSPT